MGLRRTLCLSLTLLLVSAATVAKQAHSAQPQPDSSAKEKHVKPAASTRKAVKHPSGKPVAVHHAAAKADAASRSPEPGGPDQYVGQTQVTGQSEIGSAAWYGPRHLGHRTASGDRLDGIHPTAAHRSLPLNSLVRVTNLKNGRSVIVRVTDRGPWRSNLLIDVSPKAAEDLDMKRAGIVRVKVEPVVHAGPNPQSASGSSAGVN